MFRVTNRMLYNNTLVNAFRHNENILKAQEQLSSGKRVNRPSDDPIGIGEIVTHKTRINRNEAYSSIAIKAENLMNSSDGLIGTANELAVRAKELALGQVGNLASAQTRAITAREIDQLIEQAMTIGNTQIGSDYIFGGRRTDTAPIDTNSGLYQGDGSELTAEINQNATVNISVLASDFLTSDMNVQLNSSTSVSLLNGGSGVAAGNFTITDRAGATGTVSVSAGDTIANVIAAINASAANVTASLSADNSGIRIQDNTSVASVTGPMIIAESGSTTASDLGILGSRNVQYLHGSDLNADAASATLLSDLFGGVGFTPGDIIVNNAGTSATVSFAGATTLGDMITSINATGIGATASINSAGNGISLTSASSATVAYAEDIGNGMTASLLGINGGSNLIGTLQKLSAALKANDTGAIGGLINVIDSNIDSIISARGDVGARVNRIVSSQAYLDRSTYDSQLMLNEVESADMAEVAVELSMLQTAYQATIASSASIVQPSLLDFLR